jgi:predicted house-cleaning NTP pyrophosphatase (Maf/HAM1 superfamily)
MDKPKQTKQQIAIKKLQNQQWNTLQEIMVMEDELVMLQDEIIEKRKDYDEIVKKLNEAVNKESIV